MQQGENTTLPDSLRARLWVPARHIVPRAEGRSCWLWLLRSDGRVQAVQAEQPILQDDNALPAVLEWLDASPSTRQNKDYKVGLLMELQGTAVVPTLDATVSWGHPFQNTLRAFVHQLDSMILKTLGALDGPGPYLSTITNYNRLAVLPDRVRRYRLQALAAFPPLVAPLMLDVQERPEYFAMHGYEPILCRDPGSEAGKAVLDAIDEGRELIGPLAHFHGIDRALVRLPPCREPWPDGHAPRQLLLLLKAIPARARPPTMQALTEGRHFLDNLPLTIETQADAERLARAFAKAWPDTWDELKQKYFALLGNLIGAGDFIQNALLQLPAGSDLNWLDKERLTLAWLARRGVDSLLKASARWHGQPAEPFVVDAHLPQDVPAIFGEMTNQRICAQELTSARAVHEEGTQMKHCVASYWHACALQGTRIAHLISRDDEQATAEFKPNRNSHEYKYRLAQLQGPKNAMPSPSMQRHAKALEHRLNTASYLDKRQAAIEAAEQARKAQQPVAQARPTRTLDARSRKELGLVLDYCRKQEDWCRDARQVASEAVTDIC